MNKYAEKYLQALNGNLTKSAESSALSSVAATASSAGSSLKEKIKSAIKSALNYKPDNLQNSLTKGLVAGGGAGALLGGAYGAISDPGVDEEGNRKSRLNRALGGAAVGGALGGAAGAASPLALRGAVKGLGEIEKLFAKKPNPIFDPKDYAKDKINKGVDAAGKTIAGVVNGIAGEDRLEFEGKPFGNVTPSDFIDQNTARRLQNMRNMSVGELGSSAKNLGQKYIEAISRYIDGL